MLALEFGSGIGLLVLAAALLAPYWWPPVQNEIRAIQWSWNRFWASVPSRWEKAKSHWRGAENWRRIAGVLSCIAVLGASWIVWANLSAAPISDQPSLFAFLFWGICLGTSAALFGAVFFMLQALNWAWEGFQRPQGPKLPVANPMNRVGTASPLGEARFATAKEVDSALTGRNGQFAPPKFRD